MRRQQVFQIVSPLSLRIILGDHQLRKRLMGRQTVCQQIREHLSLKRSTSMKTKSGTCHLLEDDVAGEQVLLCTNDLETDLLCVLRGLLLHLEPVAEFLCSSLSSSRSMRSILCILPGRRARASSQCCARYSSTARRCRTSSWLEQALNVAQAELDLLYVVQVVEHPEHSDDIILLLDMVCLKAVALLDHTIFIVAFEEPLLRFDTMEIGESLALEQPKRFPGPAATIQDLAVLRQCVEVEDLEASLDLLMVSDLLVLKPDIIPVLRIMLFHINSS